MSGNASNPFATRFTKPGAIDFQFPCGDSAEQLIERLSKNDWRGEIVGPHGSGKSTLLACILPILRERFPRLWLGKIAGGQRTLCEATEQPNWATAGLVVIDGYEQLSWWTRFKAKLSANMNSCGLLVTCHESVGFPEIFRTNPTPALVKKLAHELQNGSSVQITSAEVAQCYQQHSQNIREAMFAMYDLFEQKRQPHRSG